MQRPKTAAATVGLVAVTTATAFALNVGVLEATGPASADEPSSTEPEVVTVVVDAPVDPTTTMPAPTTAPAAPAATAPTQVTASPATSPAWSAAMPAPPPTAPPPTVAPPTTAGPPTVAPTTTAGPPSTVSPTVPPSGAPTTEYLTFATAGGDVVIADHGSTLEFWAADPPPGWAYRVEDPSGREIEIEYRRGEQEAKVKVTLEGGRVRVASEGFGGDGDDD